MTFDLNSAKFSTEELLSCLAVHYGKPEVLSQDAFKQWVNRGVISLSSRKRSGRGRPAVHSGTDIIQVATIFELARQGILVRKARIVWKELSKLLIAALKKDIIVILHHDVHNFLHFQLTTEKKLNFSNLSFDKLGYETDSLRVVFLYGRFVQRYIREMAILLEMRENAAPVTKVREIKP